MRFPDMMDRLYMAIISGAAVAVGASGLVSAVAACGGLPSYHLD